MKITKKQLRKIISEEIATVNDDAIEDVVMGVLSDEGGAAGEEPIADALEDLEDDEMSLPDEDMEDIIGSVPGVKRHKDGDYVDATQLEGKKIQMIRKLVNEAMRMKVWDNLDDAEKARLRQEYEADPDSSRYKRVVPTSMVDAMYGRRGSVVEDQKENVRLMFTYRMGQGGSLGS